MFSYKILFLHLFILYTRYFLITTIILAGFFCITNAFDVIQKFRDFDVSLSFFLQLILYKIPFLLNEVVALISFISMIFFLNRLVKNNELTVILCNGLSFWRVIFIPVFACLLFGLIFLAVISPFSTYALHKLTKIENRITKKQSSLLFMTASFLFFETISKENRIIKATSINFDNQELYNVTVLFIDKNNNFIKRIDAKLAQFEQGILKLIKADVISSNYHTHNAEIKINTNLTIENFTRKLMPPEKILIWELPKIIDQFFKAGLTTIEYKTYYYRQVLKPLIMSTMVIFAACFLSLNQRSRLQPKIVGIGLFMGLVLFFLLQITIKILIYNNVDPIFAILLPIILIILISNFVILHFYEA